MKVVVFMPYAVYSPHLETDLEIIQTHLDQGDDVVVLGCKADLCSCDMNISHDPNRCFLCIGKRQGGMSLLSRRVRVKRFARYAAHARDEIEKVPTRFKSVEELKGLRIGAFDIGYGALSSLVSFTRDPDVDLVRHADVLAKLIRASLLAYRAVERYLQKHAVDRVYIYNGRYGPMRAALRACQAAGIECFTHERGHDLKHYALYRNTTIHDLHHVEELMRKQWQDAAGNPGRESVARRWYEERAKGVVQNWHSYVANQAHGSLPPGWNPSKRNIAIFNSSEDEFVAIGDQWKNPVYSNQLDAMKEVIRSIEAQPDNLHLYLRIHPNLATVNNEQTRAIHELRAPFLTVIPASDPTSTYALMGAANNVLSFGSSAGIEAVYWGKPSILAGACFYRNLGGTYNPASHDEVISLLKSDLKPQGIEGALIYGYYFATFGVPFKYFEPTGVAEGVFKGQKIHMPLLTRAELRIRRHLNPLVRMFK